MDQTITAGQRLVESLSEDGDRYSLTVLIVECGRIADRLEDLDRIISGQQTMWARLVNVRGTFGDGDLEVRIDNVLPEAARQATVLKQLLAEIARVRAATPQEPDDDDLAGL